MPLDGTYVRTPEVGVAGMWIDGGRIDSKMRLNLERRIRMTGDSIQIMYRVPTKVFIRDIDRL
jgi:hypothetical protein